MLNNALQHELEQTLQEFLETQTKTRYAYDIKHQLFAMSWEANEDQDPEDNYSHIVVFTLVVPDNLKDYSIKYALQDEHFPYEETDRSIPMDRDVIHLICEIDKIIDIHLGGLL